MPLLNNTNFDFNFAGRTLDGNDYSCSVHISGDPKIIGKMLAKFALTEAGGKRVQPLEVLLSALETIQKGMPGLEAGFNLGLNKS